jgi:hypothetical protein
MFGTRWPIGCRVRKWACVCACVPVPAPCACLRLLRRIQRCAKRFVSSFLSSRTPSLGPPRNTHTHNQGAFYFFFWVLGKQAGPRRTRLRGAPLPHSHNALVTTPWFCAPAGGPSEGPGEGAPTTPRAYLCSVEGPSVLAGAASFFLFLFFLLSTNRESGGRSALGPADVAGASCPDSCSLGRRAVTKRSQLMTPHLCLFLGGAFTIGQAAQRIPQKNTDPALAGSARTQCTRTHSWCNRHTQAL